MGPLVLASLIITDILIFGLLYAQHGQVTSLHVIQLLASNLFGIGLLKVAGVI